MEGGNHQDILETTNIRHEGRLPSVVEVRRVNLEEGEGVSNPEGEASNPEGEISNPEGGISQTEGEVSNPERGLSQTVGEEISDPKVSPPEGEEVPRQD